MSRVQPIPPREQRQDLAALRERGVKITEEVDELLWRAIDWHDVTRDAWAAKVIRASQRGREVDTLRAALARWAEEREEAAARAETAEWHRRQRSDWY